MKPRMFIGSSVEQLPLAKAVQNNLQHTIQTTIWTQGVFKPSKSALDSGPAVVQHMGNHFQAVIETNNQRFEVAGTVERNLFVTGSWSDTLKGASYFGSFQLAISPRHDKLHGKWVGFNSKNQILSGDWIWEKVVKKSIFKPQKQR